MQSAFFVMFVTAGFAYGAGVTVRFDPSVPSVGPYPSNALTVPDSRQLTAIRMNLPLPNCANEPSTCAEVNAVNQLDGFSIRPRLRIRFSGAVDPGTLKSGIAIVPVLDRGKTTPVRFGSPIAVNTLMYDPATNSAFAEPEEVLQQRSEYALVVTSAIKDASGDPVEADPEFVAFQWSSSPYAQDLWSALWPLAFTACFAPEWIVGGTVFTTMSTTASLERARMVIQGAPVRFTLNEPTGVFRTSEIAGITLHAHTGLSPVKFTDVETHPVTAMAGVDRVAFGSYGSPQFAEGLVIPTTPSGADVGLPSTFAEVPFHVYLPAGPAPARGYPVVIVGHGYPDGRFRQAPSVAATFASAGFATIAIDGFGHGYGPQSTLFIKGTNGATTELKTPGRGIDFDRNGTVDQGEGCIVPAGPQVIINRDCLRQTAIDLMQLIRVIRGGMDLTRSGRSDLDGNRIYYVGHSMGADYGMLLSAVEEDLEATVINSGGGTVVDSARWGGTHPVLLAALSLRQPNLINRPGPAAEMAWPLRDQPVRMIGVTGAVAIQEWAERVEWVMMMGDPLAYAAHLPSSKLGKARRVLFQVALGDRSEPNPIESNVIRAAGMKEMTSLYRHDLAYASVAGLPLDPHPFAFPRYGAPESQQLIAAAAQKQMVQFFLRTGPDVPDVNDVVTPLFGKRLFEIPATLPVGFNFIQP
jgi:pimeloyl-ACP methyl ester carboxylesterase